jgi:hypothetical protein
VGVVMVVVMGVVVVGVVDCGVRRRSDTSSPNADSNLSSSNMERGVEGRPCARAASNSHRTRASTI